jgi:hypothetical protein
MKRILASFALAALCLLGVISGAMAQSPNGIITGQVINGTAGGTLPPGMQVTVQGFTETALLPPQTASVDASGRFRIEGLETSTGYAYVVYTEYLGIQYGTDTIAFESGQTEVNGDISIYETTTSDESISLSRIHFVVTSTDGALEVNEVQSFSNSSDRTYIGAEPEAGAKRTVVRFAIPSAAQDLVLEDEVSGGRFIQTAAGYADTLPVIPGQGTHQVVFTYYLPYDTASTLLTTTFLYPVGAVNVFVSDTGVELSSSQMLLMGTMGTGAQAYVGYVGQDFAKGDTLSLEFKGESTGGSTYPATTGGVSNTGYVLIFGGLALLLVALAVAYPSLRRRGAPAAAAETGLAPCEDECEELMAAIADLDDLFEEGELDEETYQRRRQALKARLLEIQATAGE